MERTEDLEVQLKAAMVGCDKAISRRNEVFKMAEQVVEDSFRNAIAQVQCLNPGLNLVLDGLNKDCEVQEGKLDVFSKD